MVDDTSIDNVIIDYINKETDQTIPVEMLRTASFAEMGLDSERLIFLTGELSDRFDVDIDPVIVFEYSNVTSLARYIEKIIGNR
jgi:acyl carrier protein